MKLEHSGRVDKSRHSFGVAWLLQGSDIAAEFRFSGVMFLNFYLQVNCLAFMQVGY